MILYNLNGVLIGVLRGLSSEFYPADECIYLYMSFTTTNTSTAAMSTANMLIAVVTYDYVSGRMTESKTAALTLGLVLAVPGLTLLPSLLLRFPVVAAQRTCVANR